MSYKKVGFKHKNKRINLKVNEYNIFQRFIGLMFSRREKAEALLFEFKNKTRIHIHSFFVFYDFVAIWLDEKDKIIKISVVKPFTPTLRPEKSFKKIIEIPINKNYSKVVKLLVGN